MRENKKLVTVASPFHNTNLNFFKHCMESLKKQTIGFENIEWIITMHNTEQEYIDGVKEMTAAYPNIRLYEIYNDFRTASSPRNECIKHVSTRYVFFLDSDDFLFPETLEKLSNAMESSDADIGSCREESIEGTEGLQNVDLLRAKLLLDQTKPLLVLDRNDKEMELYYDWRNMSVHKMYRVSLFKENDLRFRDEVVLGEDVVFNLDCAKYIRRVVVLPQYIGYGYFLNAGSLAQTGITGEISRIESYLTDRMTWVEMAYASGLNTNTVAWMGMVSAAKMLRSPGLPPEFVNKWREKFAPYTDKFLPLKASKFDDQQTMDGIMMLCKTFFGVTGDAGEVNRNIDLLWPILRKNAGTDIGKNYHFDSIHTYDAFKRNVPLSGYDYYAPLIELTTRLGEVDIFCGESLSGYSLSSGTTGAPRKVPYTADHLIAYASCMRDILLEGESTFAMLESLPREKEFVDKTGLDSIIGATLRCIRMELSECSYAKKFKQGVMTSPFELFFPSETIDPRYTRLLFALLDPSVSQIVAPFTWTILDTMQYLEKNYEKLLNDIEKGTLSSEAGLPDEMRTSVAGKIKADPERAAALRNEMEKGFENIIPRIWPRCKRIVSAGTGAFLIHTKKLKYYSGDISMNNGFCASSEAMIGRSMGNDTDEYALLIDNAFFEFLKPKGTEPVDAEGVKEGEEYEIILTNSAGFYRYRSGDVIKIVRKENNVPIFTFEYRLEDCIELDKATITDKMLEKVVDRFEERTGADIRDFCAMKNEEKSLTVFLEPFGLDDSSDKLRAMSEEEKSRLADETIGRLCPDYIKAREAGRIQTARIRLLEPETHLLYRDRRMFTEKTAPDQIKPIRVLNTDEKQAFFTALAYE